MAICYDRIGEGDKAKEEFEGALKEAPNDPSILNNMGINAKKSGRTEDAVKAYKEAIEAHPDYSLGYYNYGITLTEQGNLSEAIEAFNKSRECNPNNHFATLAIANAHELMDSLELALAEYERVRLPCIHNNRSAGNVPNLRAWPKSAKPCASLSRAETILRKKRLLKNQNLKKTRRMSCKTSKPWL